MPHNDLLTKYPSSTWSYGAELEVGDVDVREPLPPILGTWARTETDVVNIHGEQRGVACDPLGESPPWGGEVNMTPAPGPKEAGDRMRAIISELISRPGNRPSFTAMNASHVHVRVPGLRDDIVALKRLQDYVVKNQDAVLERMFGEYVPPPWARSRAKSHTIPLDGKRKMQPWMNDNIQRMAETVEQFFVLQRMGKDGRTPYRIFRYCVNTYNLALIDTVEFRWFRPSLSPAEWLDMFLFCEAFLLEALSDDPRPVGVYLHRFSFPPNPPHNIELMEGWERTRYTQDRFKSADVVRRKLSSVV
jgi:hypothetical protein